MNYTELLEASAKTPYQMPTEANRMSAFADRSREVEAHAAAVRPLVHARVYEALETWRSDRALNGSVLERHLYNDLDVYGLIDRLLRCRPLAFLTASDQFLLRDGRSGSGGFARIGGPDQTDLRVEDLLSYDEMAWSALVSVSVPTHFINGGGRFNRGVAQAKGIFQDRGVYVGLVGARYERPGQMAWRSTLVTPAQNRGENGYGAHAEGPSARPLKIWARLFGLSHLATFDEAQAHVGDRFHPVSGGFLDCEAYRARIRMVVEPFLHEASDRALAADTRAYAHIVGLGLGVWQIHPVQRELMLQVYGEVLRNSSFPGLADVDFSWFGDPPRGGGLSDGKPVGPDGVCVHFSKRDPAEKLVGVNAGKLLVAQYAWDANAFPGNEYWMGSLAASGDPAAACCSMIPELQNPDVNPALSGARVQVWGATA